MKRIPLVLLLPLASCAADTTYTEIQGVTRYRDATTDADGAPRAPASPASLDADISVVVHGQATLNGVDASCVDAAAGRFVARYGGTADIAGDGAYLATLGSSALSIKTPGGCDIPDLTVLAITEVVVRGELETTSPTCDAYCAASARADAEAACTGDIDVIGCRAQTESSAQATCQLECTTQRTAIVAETSLSANVLGEIDAEGLRTATLGVLAADLAFDALE